MVNYTNVTETLLPEMEAEVGTGLEGLFGYPVIIGIVGLIIIVILGYKLDLDVDTRVLSFLTMIFILMGVYLPEWIFWITLLPIGIYAGVVFSRIIHK